MIQLYLLTPTTRLAPESIADMSDLKIMPLNIFKDEDGAGTGLLFLRAVIRAKPYGNTHSHIDIVPIESAVATSTAAAFTRFATP